MGNIGYTELVQDRPWDQEQVDDLVELMVEAACSTIRVGGNEVPPTLVRRRLLGLSGDHLRFVLDCLQRNTTQVRNIKGHLPPSLYNALVTVENSGKNWRMTSVGSTGQEARPVDREATWGYAIFAFTSPSAPDEEDWQLHSAALERSPEGRISR